MPGCIVKWCRSHTRFNCPGITFHYFPTDLFRKNKWIAAVRLERQDNDWMPAKTSRICSIHFDENSFYKSSKGYTMLQKTAVPVCTMIQCESKLRNKTNTADPQAHEAQQKPKSMSFPANELTRVMWTDIVRKQRGEETWMANRSSKICCAHFKPEDKYTSDKGNIMVKKSAIPYAQRVDKLSTQSRRFPQEVVWKDEWVAVIRKHRHDPEWTPTQYSRVCSNHFKPTDLYETGKGLKRITKGAVPCFQVPPPAPATANTEEDDRSGSPLSEDLISDTDSIFDTPLLSTLKKQLDIERKKSKNYQKQAYAFKKRAKYFENKNAKLRGIVKQLKNRNELYKKIISKLTETVKKYNQDSL